MPTRPRPRSWLFHPDRPDKDATVRFHGLPGTTQRVRLPGIKETRQISFKLALRLAARDQRSLDEIERLRGTPLHLTSSVLQVERMAPNQRRVFRIYGPPSEIRRLTTTAA